MIAAKGALCPSLSSRPYTTYGTAVGQVNNRIAARNRYSGILPGYSKEDFPIEVLVSLDDVLKLSPYDLNQLRKGYEIDKKVIKPKGD